MRSCRDQKKSIYLYHGMCKKIYMFCAYGVVSDRGCGGSVDADLSVFAGPVSLKFAQAMCISLASSPVGQL